MILITLYMFKLGDATHFVKEGHISSFFFPFCKVRNSLAQYTLPKKN